MTTDAPSDATRTPAREEARWNPSSTLGTDRPSVARMRDVLLGGKDHRCIDRTAIGTLLTRVADAPAAARASRRFLVESVAELVHAGIRQFLDLRAGYPAAPAVHEIARSTARDATVVYGDSDPIVIAHLRALTPCDRRTAVCLLDVRRPAEVFAHPTVTGTLDLSRPVGLLLTDALPFVDLAQAGRVLTGYRDAVAPGSRIAIGAWSTEGVDPAAVALLEQVYATTESSIQLRTRRQVEALFDGLVLPPPGVVSRYRSRTAHLIAGVGVTP